MKRPGVITFIGWLLLIKSAMAAVTAMIALYALFVDKDSVAYFEGSDTSPGEASS